MDKRFCDSNLNQNDDSEFDFFAQEPKKIPTQLQQVEFEPLLFPSMIIQQCVCEKTAAGEKSESNNIEKEKLQDQKNDYNTVRNILMHFKNDLLNHQDFYKNHGASSQHVAIVVGLVENVTQKEIIKDFEGKWVSNAIFRFIIAQYFEFRRYKQILEKNKQKDNAYFHEKCSQIQRAVNSIALLKNSK